jgi:hypothetical protein
MAIYPKVLEPYYAEAVFLNVTKLAMLIEFFIKFNSIKAFNVFLLNYIKDLKIFIIFIKNIL